MDVIVPLGWVERLREVSDRMSLGIRGRLGEDSSRSEFRCVGFNPKGFVEVRDAENRFGKEGVFKAIKCELLR